MEEPEKNNNPKGENLKETTAILLIGHGSRAQGANEAQLKVANDLWESGRYLAVECAFLEISRPDIPAGLTLCRESGARRIVVIPYFLHMGTHVRRDLPEIIGKWWEAQPEIEIVEGAPLGYSPKITALVEERVSQALANHLPE